MSRYARKAERYRAPVAVGAFLLFALTAVWVSFNSASQTEKSLLLSLRDGRDLTQIAGPHWLGSVMTDITALGGTPVLSILTLLLAGFLIVRRRWRRLVLLLGVVIGQALIVQLMKDAFDRMRPDVVPHLIEASSGSFPSGHSASAASIYLLLAAMLAPSLPSSAARRYVFGAAIALALIVGMSRVFLGVHYPSDVLAGWSFGVGWTMLCLMIANRFDDGSSSGF